MKKLVFLPKEEQKERNMAKNKSLEGQNLGFEDRRSEIYKTQTPVHQKTRGERNYAKFSEAAEDTHYSLCINEKEVRESHHSHNFAADQNEDQVIIETFGEDQEEDNSRNNNHTTVKKGDLRKKRESHPATTKKKRKRAAGPKRIIFQKVESSLPNTKNPKKITYYPDNTLSNHDENCEIKHSGQSKEGTEGSEQRMVSRFESDQIALKNWDLITEDSRRIIFESEIRTERSQLDLKNNYHPTDPKLPPKIHQQRSASQRNTSALSIPRKFLEDSHSTSILPPQRKMSGEEISKQASLFQRKKPSPKKCFNQGKKDPRENPSPIKQRIRSFRKVSLRNKTPEKQSKKVEYGAEDFLREKIKELMSDIEHKNYPSYGLYKREFFQRLKSIHRKLNQKRAGFTVNGLSARKGSYKPTVHCRMLTEEEFNEKNKLKKKLVKRYLRAMEPARKPRPRTRLKSRRSSGMANRSFRGNL